MQPVNLYSTMTTKTHWHGTGTKTYLLCRKAYFRGKNTNSPFSTNIHSCSVYSRSKSPRYYSSRPLLWIRYTILLHYHADSEVWGCIPIRELGVFSDTDWAMCSHIPVHTNYHALIVMSESSHSSLYGPSTSYLGYQQTTGRSTLSSTQLNLVNIRGVPTTQSMNELTPDHPPMLIGVHR